jgi:hypothetical protein
MTETIFVNTNVFIYAVDLADPRKQQVAPVLDLWPVDDTPGTPQSSGHS